MSISQKSALNTILLQDFITLIGRKSFDTFDKFTDLFDPVWKKWFHPAISRSCKLYMAALCICL